MKELHFLIKVKRHSKASIVLLMLYANFARKGIPHLYNIDTISQWQVYALVITFYAEGLDCNTCHIIYSHHLPASAGDMHHAPSIVQVDICHIKVCPFYVSLVGHSIRRNRKR